MRAALMWTINDLPAYGMASGWSTAGIMGALFVWRTHRHFVCSMEGRHAISIVTDNFCPTTIRRRNKRSFTKKSAGKKDCTAELTGDEIRRRVEQYGTAVENH
ncbi:UNVERIFIED_CONTAM: hypothetical protein Sradi_3178700 [Sesamum radiatum]|uniref:Uncharacterized protein n=1 Tax=Sesamum radiatum TaxID=300843 RepID=A0AAW2REN8_SESRA